MRTWIEAGCKETKRGGWPWEQTKMTDPDRATRLWLARALATLWVVSVGGQADDSLPVSTLDDFPPTHSARQRLTKQTRPRLLSWFRWGVLIILTRLMAGEAFPLGRFLPEPWSQEPPMSRLVPSGTRSTKGAA